MTLLERRVVSGKTYEVHETRGARRLYTDGVLHTHFDARQPISGRVWDLLALPGIVRAPARVLVLGVAGGAVIRQLLAFAAPVRIDAVDLDRTHLALGARHFGLDDPRVRLHRADARDFVRRSRASYDVIIDDVFCEVNGEPKRAITYDTAWGELVRARLARGGVLVVNSAGPREVRGTVLASARFHRRFASVIKLETETAGNVVLALSQVPMDARHLRSAANKALGRSATRLRMTLRTVYVRGGRPR